MGTFWREMKNKTLPATTGFLQRLGGNGFGGQTRSETFSWWATGCIPSAPLCLALMTALVMPSVIWPPRIMSQTWNVKCTTSLTSQRAKCKENPWWTWGNSRQIRPGCCSFLSPAWHYNFSSVASLSHMKQTPYCKRTDTLPTPNPKNPYCKHFSIIFYSLHISPSPDDITSLWGLEVPRLWDGWKSRWKGQ